MLHKARAAQDTRCTGFVPPSGGAAPCRVAADAGGAFVYTIIIHELPGVGNRRAAAMPWSLTIKFCRDNKFCFRNREWH
jgi:hypothetical protein